MSNYQGWKNYATWNVVLWIRNDEALYRAMRKEPHPFTEKSVEEFLKRLLPKGTPDLEDRANPYEGVDWSEVSRAFNED